MAIQLNSDYKIKDDPVTLTVIIGNGQFGASGVLLDTVSLPSGNPVTDLPIGNGSSLDKKKLKVVTIVSDTNPSTNQMNVQYILKGGVNDQTYALTGTVANEGDALTFIATFDLQKIS